jgi:DNA repair protein RadD
VQVLRDYQLEAANDRIPAAFRAGRRKVCAVSPCGSGKTTVIAELCRRAADKGTPTLVAAHRRRLVKQLAERMVEFGVDFGVLMADLPAAEEWAVYRPAAPVQVGSRDTLLAWGSDRPLPPAKLFIPDECHLVGSPSYRRLRDGLAPEYTVGFTATPCLPDGSGFGPDLFDALVEVATIQGLLARDPAVLVPVGVYAPVGVGRRRRKGLATGVSGDPVRHWRLHADGLRTVTFCRTIAEATAVREMFRADGVAAEHVNADTPDELRDKTIRRLEDRDILVLTCTPGLLGVGVDIPSLECVQSLTKNHSPVAHWQGLGRAMRTAAGKAGAVLLDHAAAVYQHGMPDASPAWALGESDSVQRRAAARLAEGGGARPQVCPACGCVSAGAAGRCPGCRGLLARPKPAATPATEREPLAAVGGVADRGGADTAMQTAWVGILYSCGASGAPCKVAAVRFKGRFGVWPAAAGVSPVPAFADSGRPVGEVLPAFARKVRV